MKAIRNKVAINIELAWIQQQELQKLILPGVFLLQEQKISLLIGFLLQSTDILLDFSQFLLDGSNIFLDVRCLGLVENDTELRG